MREVAGTEIYQSYVGSSANPGYRDFAVTAEIVKGRKVHPRISFDINPSSRQILVELIRDGRLTALIEAGATAASGGLQRLHRHGAGPGDR